MPYGRMLYQAITVSTLPCAEAREEVGEWISKGTFLGKDGSPVILMYPGVEIGSLCYVEKN